LVVALGVNAAVLRLQLPALVGVVLSLVAIAVPYTTFVMYSTYVGYEREYEEGARTLGAGRLAVLTRIHLPLVAPALATAAFLAFLVGWSDYIVTVVVGGGLFVTAPMLVGALASGSGTEPVVAAASLAAVVPPVILLVATFGLVRWGPRR
jgi:putative spermidine/putrescine transport system permease protein